jgi:TolA-binding protein
MSSQVEDLSALARRGDLSRDQLRAFERALDSSVEVRLLHEAGLAMDQEEVARVGDEEIVARLVARAVGAQPALSRSWRWLKLSAAVAVGLAAFGLSSVAAARFGLPFATPVVDVVSAWGAALVRGASPAVVAQLEVGTIGPAIKSQLQALSVVHSSRWLGGVGASAAVARTPDAVGGDFLVADSSPSGSEASATAAVGVAPQLSKVALPTAAETYARANLARRNKELGLAMKLYEGVLITAPGSPEAQAARPALAQLCLRAGRAGEARRHFTEYLRRAPSGTLAPEALWGLVQIAQSSGDRAGLQRAAEGLQLRFPNSAYASKAAALVGAASGPR